MKNVTHHDSDQNILQPCSFNVHKNNIGFHMRMAETSENMTNCDCAKIILFSCWFYLKSLSSLENVIHITHNLSHLLHSKFLFHARVWCWLLTHSQIIKTRFISIFFNFAFSLSSIPNRTNVHSLQEFFSFWFCWMNALETCFFLREIVWTLNTVKNDSVKRNIAGLVLSAFH